MWLFRGRQQRRHCADRTKSRRAGDVSRSSPQSQSLTWHSALMESLFSNGRHLKIDPNEDTASMFLDPESKTQKYLQKLSGFYRSPISRAWWVAKAWPHVTDSLLLQLWTVSSCVWQRIAFTQTLYWGGVTGLCLEGPVGELRWEAAASSRTGRPALTQVPHEALCLRNHHVLPRKDTDAI